MNIWANYIASWQQIFNYRGKTRRRDFWAAIIGMVIASIVVSTILSGATGLSDGIALPAHWLENFFFLAQFLQYLSMSVRRLHSLSLSGHYQWLMLVPGVHMIVLHALPEVEKDPRAPWYNMMSVDNGPASLEVNHRGHVSGILSNAFGYTWRNMFNFRDTVSRGNYLWARVTWSIFSLFVGALLSLTIFLIVVVRIFVSLLMNRGNTLQLNPSLQSPTFDPSVLNGLGLFIIPVGLIVGFLIVFPIVSLTARRLHDQELSAWWVFLYLAGSVGSLILLLLSLLPAKDGQTKYPVADGRPAANTESSDSGDKSEQTVSASAASSQASVEVFYPQSVTSAAQVEVFYPQSSTVASSESAATSDTSVQSNAASEDRDDHV